MERKIGETFTVNGKTFYVEKQDKYCNGCAFYDSECKADLNVVGSCFSYNRTDREAIIFKEAENNMKPFNFEEAKAGKAVCTRGGNKVRILCTDLRGPKKESMVVAIDEHTYEAVWTYPKSGKYHDGVVHNLDLMMVVE